MFSSDFAADLRDMNRQRLLRRVTQSILRVQALAHDTQRLRNALERVLQEMQRLHFLNRDLLLADAKRNGGYFLIWFALVACCLVDFILLSAIAEYFASRVYSDPAMIMLARIVIPLAIVTIEMLVSTQRAFAQQQQADFSEKKSEKSWVIFTAGLLLFLPAMLVATHLVILPESLTPLWFTVSLVQLLGLVALAMVVHGVVLYGGALAVEAKAYLYLKLRWWQLSARERRLSGKVAEAISQLTQSYVLYMSLAQDLIREFPSVQLEQARFDTTTQTLLLESYGGNLPMINTSSRRFEGEVFEA